MGTLLLEFLKPDSHILSLPSKPLKILRSVWDLSSLCTRPLASAFCRGADRKFGLSRRCYEKLESIGCRLNGIEIYRLEFLNPLMSKIQ